QPRQAIDDGQPQAQSLRAVPLGIPDLVELLEDVAQMRLLDADAGVVYGDAPRAAARAAAYRDAAGTGVADRVGHQVAQDALEQRRIAAHHRGGRHEAQTQSLVGGVGRALARNPVEHYLDRQVAYFRPHDAGVELGDVQQRMEEPFQSLHRRR